MNRWGMSRECDCGRTLDGGELCPECDAEEINWQLNMLEDEKHDDCETDS
jgi:hypothetical protein